MTERDLIYWLQGLLEYTDVPNIGAEEARTKLQGIKDHLALMTNKVTPKTPLPAVKETPKVPSIFDSIRPFENPPPLIPRPNDWPYAKPSDWGKYVMPSRPTEFNYPWYELKVTC